MCCDMPTLHPRRPQSREQEKLAKPGTRLLPAVCVCVVCLCVKAQLRFTWCELLNVRLIFQTCLRRRFFNLEPINLLLYNKDNDNQCFL